MKRKPKRKAFKTVWRECHQTLCSKLPIWLYQRLVNGQVPEMALSLSRKAGDMAQRIFDQKKKGTHERG